MLKSLAALGAGQMCESRFVYVRVWEKTEIKTVQDEMKGVRPKIHFPYDSDNLTSPLYGDLLRPHPWECQHFTAWLWKAGRDKASCKA